MNIQELIEALEKGTEIATQLGHHTDVSAARGVLHLLRLARDGDQHREPPKDVIMSAEPKPRPFGCVSFGRQQFDLSDGADASAFRAVVFGTLGPGVERVHPPIVLGAQLLCVRSRRGIAGAEWAKVVPALAIDFYHSDSPTRPGAIFPMSRSRSEEEIDACFAHVERAAAARGIEIERVFDEVPFPDGPKAMRAGYPLDLVCLERIGAAVGPRNDADASWSATYSQAHASAEASTPSAPMDGVRPVQRRPLNDTGDAWTITHAHVDPIEESEFRFAAPTTEAPTDETDAPIASVVAAKRSSSKQTPRNGGGAPASP
jgi:hypothetical protein